MTGQTAVAENTSQKTSQERKELLARALQGQIADGARVESQSDHQAVVVKGHRVNHVLHLLLGFVTLGAWWLVWIAMAIFGGESRRIVSADEFGNVTVQRV